MPPRRQTRNPTQDASYVVRFADDPGLTFVNYDPNDANSSGYQRQARLHNAHRRSWRPVRSSRATLARARDAQQRIEGTISPPAPLLNPVSTYGRDPFSQDVLIPAQNLETIWRSIFSDYFYLPQLTTSGLNFPNPANLFLNSARASRDIYRTLVVQAVVTAEVGRGNQPDEAVFRNQALVIRDFRRLVDAYDSPTKILSDKQFEHVFATAFSMSGHGFNQQAAYDSIVFCNALFMCVPENRAVAQTAVTDWIRMLMPRPGPTFNRSDAFQLDMLRKINLTFDFLEGVRNNTNNKFPGHISRYVIPGTALHTVITTRLADQIPREPYPGFYIVCLHRLLSLFYRYLEYLCDMQTTESERLLSSLETSASICIQYPPPQRIALFLWSLVTSTVDTRLNNDLEEQVFAWIMKDLIPLHRISFTDELAVWLIQRCSPGDNSEPLMLDLDELRERMRRYYDENYQPAAVDETTDSI